jgi:hypothetical protein
MSCAVCHSDLYNSVYDLSVSEYGAVYLLITIAAAVLLTLAYRNVEQGTAALSALSSTHARTWQLCHTRRQPIPC